MHRILTPALIAVTGMAASASVSPTFFAFQENTLHRVNADSSVDQFTLSATMVSSAFNPQGRLIGMDGRTGSPPFSSYELMNPFGAAPSLGLVSNTLINRDTDSLYTVDYVNITSSLVGSLGVNFQNAGAEFFGGRLYLAGQNLDSGFFEIGEVNVFDGSYSTMFQLGGFIDPGVQTELVSLAVIPAPGAIALLGLGGLALSRRRR